MSRFIMPRQGVKGQNINPADGALLYFYTVGTVTPKDTYNSAAKTTANTNPVVADSSGLFGHIELDGSYDVVLKNKNGVQIWGPETVSELASTDEPVSYATLAAMVADIANLSIGEIYNIGGRTSLGDGGAARWSVVDATTVTENEIDIVTGDAIKSLQINERQSYNLISQLGGVSGSDCKTVAERIITLYNGLLVDSGTWKLKDITIGSNFYLNFRRRTSVLAGIDTADDIFISSGAVTGVNVSGPGRFNLCGNAFLHTGNSALASSVFKDFLFTNGTAAFDLSSAVGVTFDGLQFGVGSGADNIDYGVRFRKTGTGQTNVNTFKNNRYANYSVAGVSYDDSAVVADINYHYNDWFEDAAVEGLFVGGGVNNLKLFGGYFETTGSATKSDIEVNVTTGTSTGITLYGVGFRASEAAQTSRIKTTGNCSVTLHDCDINLSAGQVAVEVASAGGAFLTRLYNNRLNAVGAGTYESRLFSKTGTQQVDWSTYVGSALATDDDFEKRVMTGAIVYPWVTFSAADATPTVRGGTHFKTSGTTTITTFDDGTDGQIIRVKAGNTITVVGLAMVLNDVAEFINDGGTWRHINK